MRLPRYRDAATRGVQAYTKTVIPSRIGRGLVMELAQGKDAGKLTHELATRRADKPNPLYYAQRTIDIASARQVVSRSRAD